MIADKIPTWVLRIALLLSLPIAGAALYLTRTYAVGNLAVLGLDADTIFVRRLSIDVLLSAHVAAFFMIALLPDRVFRFRRWQLRILAIAIWAFDGAAIYQARFGVMDSAATAQTTAVTRLADQRAAIKGLQESAAALRVTAARQMANKMITEGGKTQKEAARLEAKAAAMAEQLAAMPQGTGTTEVRTWGWLAPYKAATESALISFVSLIMLGLSGLAVRGLLEMSAAKRVLTPLPTPLPAREPAPAPAPVAAPVAKTAPERVSLLVKLLRAMGILTGGAAAAASPAVRAEPVQNPPVVTAPDQRKELAPRVAPEPAKAQDVQKTESAPAAPERVHTPALERVQEVQKLASEVQAAAPAKRTRKAAPAAPDARPKELILTEVLVGAIKAGEGKGGCKPSQRSIRDFLKCNQTNADWYLAGLHKLGVIEPRPSGKGWQVKA
jgi:hypothetical protein